jgi:hypothetical protein
MRIVKHASTATEIPIVVPLLIDTQSKGRRVIAAKA